MNNISVENSENKNNYEIIKDPILLTSILVTKYVICPTKRSRCLNIFKLF